MDDEEAPDKKTVDEQIVLLDMERQRLKMQQREQRERELKKEIKEKPKEKPKEEPKEEPEEEIGEEPESEPVYEIPEEEEFAEEIVEEEPKEEEEKPAPKKMEVPDTSYLIKELTLFKYEWLILGFGTFLSIIILFVNIAMFIINGSFSIVNVLLAFLPFVIFAILAWGIYIIKFTFFMPRGKKVIVARIMKNTGVHLSAENAPKDSMIRFDNKDEVAPVHVPRMNDHFEITTGKPFIFAVEGHGQTINIINLIEDKLKLNLNAKELSTLFRSIWAAGFLAGSANLMKMGLNKLKEPENIAIIIILVLVIITAFLTWQQGNYFQEIITTLGTIAENTGTVIQVG